MERRRKDHCWVKLRTCTNNRAGLNCRACQEAPWNWSGYVEYERMADYTPQLRATYLINGDLSGTTTRRGVCSASSVPGLRVQHVKIEADAKQKLFSCKGTLRPKSASRSRYLTGF